MLWNATTGGEEHDGNVAGPARDRASGQPTKGAGLTVERMNTAPVHPYDEVTWERATSS